MNITVLYVGSSLLAPLKQAERDINHEHALGLRIAAYNFGASLTEDEWREVEGDLSAADVVFVIHVMDGENAARLLDALERFKARPFAVIVINCMPELMRRTRMGKLDFGRMFGGAARDAGMRRRGDAASKGNEEKRAKHLAGRIGAWMGEQAGARREKKGHGSSAQYLKLVDRLPAILRFIPSAGRLRDVKNYLYLFCYFLQPTPANISSMLLYAIRYYVLDERVSGIQV